MPVRGGIDSGVVTCVPEMRSSYVPPGRFGAFVAASPRLSATYTVSLLDAIL